MEVDLGVFHVLTTQGIQNGRGECGSCVVCGEGSSSGTVELSDETVGVFLQALLVDIKDDGEDEGSSRSVRFRACGGCCGSLFTLVELFRQLEELRVKFNNLRRLVGGKVILGSLGRSQEDFEGWVEEAKTVEDVFPSAAKGRLNKNVGVVGTEEFVGDEEVKEEFLTTETAEEMEDDVYEAFDLFDDIVINPQECQEESLRAKRDEDVKLTKMRPVVILNRTLEVPEHSETAIAINPSPLTSKPNPSESNRKAKKSLLVTSINNHCKPCNLNFSSVEELEDHEASMEHPQSRYTPKVFNCPKCGKACEGRKSLRRHLSAVHASDRHTCLECGKGFPTIGSLRWHKEKFHIVGLGGTPSHFISCAFCSKVLNRKCHMRRHCYRFHRPEYMKDSKHVCLVCFRLFPTEKALTEDHMKVHESLKCGTCGKYFRLKSVLDKHRRVHTGEKPFACIFCDKRFSESSNLREHALRHMGDKPFVCSCGRGYIRNSFLSSHKAKTGHC